MVIPKQLEAKGSQPRYGLGVARSSGVRLEQGSGVVWCRPGVSQVQGSRKALGPGERFKEGSGGFGVVGAGHERFRRSGAGQV